VSNFASACKYLC